MLSRKNKLRFKSRLPIVKTISSPFFIVRIAKNKDQEAKFAIVIKKIVDKRAVYRNKLKRSMTRALGEMTGDIKQGYDFLIFAKKPALGKSVVELRKEMHKKLKEEGFIL